MKSFKRAKKSFEAMNYNFLLEFKTLTMKGVLALLFITVALGMPTGPNHNPMFNEGLFEGDMVVDPDFDRNAVPRDSQRWPGGVIPYVVDGSLRDVSPVNLRNAMYNIMKASCIRFVPRTHQHTYYLKIFKGNGCWSYWGFLNAGMQNMSLGEGCNYQQVIEHELLHAIGFEHEHSRPDRDDYLIIHLKNVHKNQTHNFKKYLPSENRLFTSFDYDSIMLYDNYAFSDRPGVLKTMEARDGRVLPSVIEKPGLSNSDIYRLRKLYQCK